MDRTAEELRSPPVVVRRRDGDLDELLAREWLISNRIGAYASSTVLCCNTRRYHGLLVAATVPPMGRIVALSTVMEQLSTDRAAYELGMNEFPGAFAPMGMVHLEQCRLDAAATFIFRLEQMELRKEVILADRANAVAVQYTLTGGSATLRLRPLVAMRDFHRLRPPGQDPKITFETDPGGVVVQDRSGAGRSLYLLSNDASFQGAPQWWRQFHYRADFARGHHGREDLYSPGVFTYDLIDGKSVQFNASLDEPIAVGFETTVRRRRRRLEKLTASVGDDADEATRRLAAATDAFVVQRGSPAATSSATILAGYHWFADWGRDAFVALPGLLLSTGRFDLARRVFTTFVDKIADGMIPNRFDDYAAAAHYNSIDASLWFIVAAERYIRATGDIAFWREVLMPAALTIVGAYQGGTRFDIRADGDGLLTGGAVDTQLTWMDVKLGDEAITPRHGKAVEVNALWYNAQRILAERCRGIDDTMARHYDTQADLMAPAFVRTFWNDEGGCCYDCVTEGHADASIRPNQIFAVSLPYSPLTVEQQHGVLRVVTEELLTPVGLRTLSPRDPRYRSRYGGSWESRDRAYHQGTVWAWLLGAYVEAYLKLEGDKPFAVARANELLGAFDDHLLEAGLGYVSEIFDADPPHRPRGCIAQAWSVAEILRAKKLVSQHARRL